MCVPARVGDLKNVIKLTCLSVCLRAACINQDSSNPAEDLDGALTRIIGSCDMMVTPIHDPDWRNWSIETQGINDPFHEYRAPDFVQYLGRAWLRLEMFLNANMPFSLTRHRLFGGALHDVVAREKRRPHLIFGTREKEQGEMPIILPALNDHDFEDYNPAKGTVTDPRDFKIINAYVEELLKNNRNLKV
jgi:hypothetical protein